MSAATAFDVNCEWGEAGISCLRARSDVIVDVLSFSTAVDVATSRGAAVFPFRWRETAADFAREKAAELAGPRGESRYSLSPDSYLEAPRDLRVVLPSPNGSQLSVAAGDTCTFAGCLRNAAAVARGAALLGRRVSVVPAGERWPDGSLRPALEDWLGAGAILARLPGRPSPEARAAAEAFESAKDDLFDRLLACTSGRELEARGYEGDVRLAAELDASDTVPRLHGGAYRRSA